MRTLVILAACAALYACDPVGERRLQIPLSAVRTGHSNAQQLVIAESIADSMAQQHGWIREAVSPSQQASGVLRRYTIRLGDFTMHCELLSTHHEVQLYFKDWTSLREANEAERRMREFDREFHQALGQPQRPNQALQPTAGRFDV